MSHALSGWICDQIREHGPISFAQFMEWALYHPEFGYYTSGRVRVGDDHGDFTTAPHLSAVFARCVARWAIRIDAALGHPTPFTFVEGGPGEGRFAADFLEAARSLSPDLYTRLTYVLDEISPALRKRQAERLSGHVNKVCYGRPETQITGVYFSNELVDAFPVHRLQLQEGKLREIYVDWDGTTFREVLLEPGTADCITACEFLPLHEGCQLEIRPAAGEWLRQVDSLLERGCILTVDYGDEAERLFGPHHAGGTCVAYREHRQHSDLLLHPGQQDLTAQVDFTALRRYGETCGLSSGPLLKQRDFLLATGLIEEVERLETVDLPEAERMLYRQSLAPLIMPGAGMGDSFKVFLQTKGIAPDRFQLGHGFPGFS